MTDFNMYGTGGVGNDEVVHDFGSIDGSTRNDPPSVFRIHNAIAIPDGAAVVIEQLIKDFDLDPMATYLLMKGHYNDSGAQELFAKRLAVICRYFKAVATSFPPTRPIPGNVGIPSFRVIKDFVPGADSPQYWFELRIIIPIRPDDDGKCCLTDFHKGDFSTAITTLRDKAANIHPRIPYGDFRTLITDLYGLAP